MQPQPPSDNATLADLRAYCDEHLSGRVEVHDEDYPIPPELRFDKHGKLEPGEFKKLQDWVTQAKENGHLEQFTLRGPGNNVTAHGRREEVVQYQTNIFREAIVRALDLAYSESQAREVQAAALHTFGAAMLPPTTPLPAAVAQQTATAAALPTMESPPTAAGAAAGAVAVAVAAGAAGARALATITAAAAAGTVVVVRAAAGYLAGSDHPPAPAAASPARGQTGGDPPPTVQQRRIRPAIDRQAADVEDDSDDDGGGGVCGGGGGGDDDDDDDDVDDVTEVADPEIDALARSLSRPLVTGPKGVCPEATKLSPYTEKPWSPALTEKRFTGPLYGPTGEPTSDDVHQGALMNCYFCSALTLLAQYTPKVVVDAIKEAKPASGERMFYVRLRTKAGHLVTIEVDDHFYSQPLNLEKFTLGRLKELLSALGQPAAGKRKSDFKQQLESLPDGKRPPTLPIYCQTGDLTTDGCIWPMVLEKAWVALLSAGIVNWKKADKDSPYSLLADKRIFTPSRGSSEQKEVDSEGAFEIKAPSYENIEGHTAPKHSTVMWNKVDGACLAIGGWDSKFLATSSAGQRDEALGEKEVAELWKHVHHNGKPASLGTRELAKKDDDAAAKNQFSRLQYSHEYAVVGSAILKEDGNTRKLAYLSLGGERVVRDETVAKSLDEDTHANSVFSDTASHALSGGKYLVLRNPQNRNEQFTKEAAEAQRLNARDYRTRKPRELHRIDSLDKLNKKCFPLKYDDVDEATNIFLLRIDKLYTWSDDISQSSLFSLGTLFTPPTSYTAGPSSGGGGTPTKPKKPSSTTPGTSSRGGKSKVATDVASLCDGMLKLSF